jgi:hypothetical protein
MCGLAHAPLTKGGGARVGVRAKERAKNSLDRICSLLERVYHFNKPVSFSGLGHRVLSSGTGVRFPVPVFFNQTMQATTFSFP